MAAIPGVACPPPARPYAVCIATRPLWEHSLPYQVIPNVTDDKTVLKKPFPRLC